MNTAPNPSNVGSHSFGPRQSTPGPRLLVALLWLILTGCIIAPGSMPTPDGEVLTHRDNETVAQAPAPPQDLVLIAPGRLEWTTRDANIEYFTIYGSGSRTFNRANATIVIYPLAPRHDISAWPFDYYHVTATDLDGHESPPASIIGASGSRR